MPLIVLNGCAPRQVYFKKEPAVKAALNISNVSALPKTINAGENQRVEIKYKIPYEAGVSVDIYDAEDRWINSLKKDAQEKTGYNLAYWDGRDINGRLVPSGVYIYVIKAKDKFGNTAVYDPADSTSGLGLQESNLSYSQETGEIKYILPRAARVRIRIGIEGGGPLLRTLFNWQPREAGENSEKWDGCDEEGKPIIPRLKLAAVLSAYSLPDNSIIVKNNDFGFDQECKFEVNPQNPKRLKRNVTGIVLHPSAKFSRKKYHYGPGFRLEFPNAAWDEGGVPVLSGIAPVRVIVDEKDKDMLVESRFEMIFFVDDVFFFEEEQSFSPYNYLWNTKGITEGEHILTVNIMSYDGYIGVKNVKVKVRKGE